MGYFNYKVKTKQNKNEHTEKKKIKNDCTAVAFPVIYKLCATGGISTPS